MLQAVSQIPNWLLEDEDSSPTECALIHPYPGSMPPHLASRLIDRYSSPKDLVFDPFCGIGTVLLESLRLNRRAIGADLLPLAVEISNVAAALPPVASLIDSWSKVCEMAFGTNTPRDTKIQQTSVSGSQGFMTLRRWVHPWTYDEILRLKTAIDQIGDVLARRTFRLVLAASLPSLSKRQSRGVLHWGWIADNVVPSRGDLIPTDPFREVTSRLEKLFAFMRAVNRGSSFTSQTIAFERDWTLSGQVESLIPKRVDLLLTSPPYPYSIDYALSTRLSAYLLDLPFDDVRRREIGARYKRKRKERAAEYSAQIASSLSALGSTVRRGGFVVLVLPKPDDYASVLPFNDKQWNSFICQALGNAWQLVEWGVRSYRARRVVHSNRPQKHDRILAFKRVEV